MRYPSAENYAGWGSRAILAPAQKIGPWSRRFAQKHGFLMRAIGASAVAGVAVFFGAQSLFPVQIRYERAAAATIGDSVPVQGINIANTGLTYVQGARVTSVSGSRITAVSEWKANTFRWTVMLSSDTRVVLPGGEQGTLADIQKGDFVSITGNLAADATDMRINADVIRLVTTKTQEDAVVHLQEMEGGQQ